MPHLQLAQLGAESGPWGQYIPLMDLPPMLGSAIARLLELSRLPTNWDGYESPSLTEAAKQSAMTLLGVLRGYVIPSMRIDAVTGGGVQFEWSIGERALEIEVLPDGAIEFLVVQGDDMAEGPLTDERTLLSLLRWLMQS